MRVSVKLKIHFLYIYHIVKVGLRSPPPPPIKEGHLRVAFFIAQT